MIEVIQPGLLTTIQDFGRPGYEIWGMPPAGAMDPFLAAIANKLVGNALDSALLEFALVGPSFKFLEECRLAIAAFSCDYLLEGIAVPDFSAFLAPAGSTLQFEGMKGWFGYIAVSGGFQHEKTLGSASTYVAGNVGEKLVRNQRLRLNKNAARPFSVSKELFGFASSNVLGLLPSLHTSQFRPSELSRFAENEYRITLQSNRMGILLSGPGISAPHIRRSAPALPGSIQIQYAGHPMILGPEGPTTGGYPQIGILSQTSWTKLAQTRPGQPIRFEWQDPHQARQLTRLRNSILWNNEAWNAI